MFRAWSYMGLLGVTSLSIVIGATSALMVRSWQHRQAVSPSQGGVHGGDVEPPLVAQQCMYCDGANWQLATESQPCTMMNSSMAGQPCTYDEAVTKAKGGTSRVYRGYGLQYNSQTGQWTWRSSSSKDPAVSRVWYSSRNIRAFPRVFIKPDTVYWDIYVDD